MRQLAAVVVCLVALCAPAGAQSAGPQEPVRSEPKAETPTINASGFADVNFASTDSHLSDDGRTTDGFSLGYLMGNVNASLGGKFSVHTEVTVTTRANAFVLDVARAYVRYEYNDLFKISFGRYHAPVAYWNTAYHRGAWLQTTVFRPDLFKEEWFQPDHFLGVFAEGLFVQRAGLHYIVGYGNGRERDLGYCTDCANPHRAAIGKVFARPPQFAHLEIGGAVYKDTIEISPYEAAAGEYPELITSAYIAHTGESPEIIAEFSNLRHKSPSGQVFDSQAFYVQGAYRLPAAPKLKPYARVERAISADDEPIIGNLTNWKATAGLRIDVTDMAALKVEYGRRTNEVWRLQNPPGNHHTNGVFVQMAVAF